MDALPNRKAPWPALAIAAAVFGWGIYLAVGAATHESQDVRKSLVIIACIAGFLAFWFLFLFSGRRGGSTRVEEGSWNKASQGSLLASLLTNALVAVLLFGSAALSELTQGRILLSALVAGFLSFVLAALGLSQPTANRGKRLGIVAILLLIVALAMAIWAVQLAANPVLRR